MKGAIARTFYRFAGGEKTVPVTLGLRNIYILPTGYGLLYMTVLAGMLIGSINYNNNLGFLLTFLLGSLGVVAMLYTYGTLYGLQLRSATTLPVFAGSPMTVDIRVGGIGRPRMGLCWRIDATAQTAVDLEPGTGGGSVQVRVATRRRGPFRPGPLTIRSTYPLGLFRAWSRIDIGTEGLIYPRPLVGPVPMRAADRPAENADGETAATGGVDDFDGLAAYQTGDPPGRIHWQAFSRGRGLHVKRFVSGNGQAGMLDIDRLGGTDLERKLSVLCHHVIQADRQGRAVGLKLVRRSIPVGRGPTHRDRCLRALALVEKD